MNYNRKPLVGSSNSRLDPQIFAACMLSSSAANIADLLPDSDLCDELRTLLDLQYELFYHITEGKNYGQDNINVLIEYCDSVNAEANLIKKQSE